VKTRQMRFSRRRESKSFAVIMSDHPFSGRL
jgi:hypothetical protein